MRLVEVVKLRAVKRQTREAAEVLLRAAESKDLREEQATENWLATGSVLAAD